MAMPAFNRLMEHAQKYFAAGDLQAALEAFQNAERSGREAGMADEADRALCNACFLRVEMGRADEAVPILRRVFMGTSHPRNRCVAAYNLAAAFINTGDIEKAREWASRSRELVGEIDDPTLCAGANNQAGSLALKASDFKEARQAFENALSALEELPEENASGGRATILDNLGYCLICEEKLNEGLALCEKARGELEMIPARHLLYETLQDLCYGYILADELEKARRCGEEAIALAEEYEDLQVMKNCLFLLAETAVRAGDTFRARRYLRELAEFYPEIEMNEEMIDVFLMTDLTHVVNLRG